MEEFNLSKKSEIIKFLNSIGLDKLTIDSIITLFEIKEKEFIKRLKYWSHIDRGEQTMTIDYDKFKELLGEKLLGEIQR